MFHFYQYVLYHLVGMTCSLILFIDYVYQVKVTSGMSPAFNLYGCTLIGTYLSVIYSMSVCVFYFFQHIDKW
jgi:hypothetical protein